MGAWIYMYDDSFKVVSLKDCNRLLSIIMLFAVLYILRLKSVSGNGFIKLFSDQLKYIIAHII